jgi:hypothetical protein
VVKRLCRVLWPIRVFEHLSREQNNVGLAGSYDVIGLGRFRNKPDRRSGYPNLSSDGFRKVNLPSWPKWIFSVVRRPKT